MEKGLYVTWDFSRVNDGGRAGWRIESKGLGLND